jgi:hypothetical protein
LQTNWARISELEHLDDLGVEATKRVAGQLRTHLNLKGMYPSVLAKISRAVVERKISPGKIGDIVTYIISVRGLPKGHELRIENESKYFMDCVKSALEGEGRSWEKLGRSDE